MSTSSQRDSFESADTARASDFGPVHAEQTDGAAISTVSLAETAYTDARSEVPSSYHPTHAAPEESSQASTQPPIERSTEHEQQAATWSAPAAQAAAVAFPASTIVPPAQQPVEAGPTENLKADVAVRPSGQSEDSSLTKGDSHDHHKGADMTKKRSSTSSPRKSSEGDDKVEFDPYAHFSPDERRVLEAQSAVPEPRKVTLIELFRFQTRWELALNAIGIFCACVSGAAQPLMTVVFGSVTTSFTQYFAYVIQGAPPDVLEQAKRDVLHKTNVNTLYLVYIGIATIFVTYIYEYSFTMSAENTARRIRERYYASVLRQNVAYFDKLGAGEVATRIETDCHLVQDGISDKIPISFSFLAMFVSGFIIAFIRNWLLALALSSIVPIIAISGFVMNSFETRLRRAMLDEVSKGGTLAEEVISSVRTVFAFGNQDRLAAKYDAVNVKAQKMGYKVALGHSLGLGVFFFVIYACYGLAFQFGTTLFLSGRATSGEIVNVFFAIMIGAFSLAQLPPNLEALALALGAASKLFDTIDRIPPIDSSSDKGLKPEISGLIEFDNVSFYYPSRPSVKVLDDVSITFNKGETTALVGASGAGKSSVVGIIERFYQILRGQVRIDGMDLDELNIKHLRRNIGLVSQEPVLFSGTILENVAHGLVGTAHEAAAEEKQRDLVVEACKKANAHSFISSLPDGYETRIGERGALLSGGQRQRISIARAIIKNPPILLLDEATSALDTESERLVQAAIDEVSVGRTTIVIAHRLSTIRDAHKIVVMGEGRILEQGTHAELLEKEDGPYYRLVNAQKIKEANMDDKLEEAEDEKTLLHKEAEATEASGGKIQRTVTGISASSEILANRKDNKGKQLGSFAVAMRIARLCGHQRGTYLIGLISCIIIGCVYPCVGIVFGYVLQIYSSPDRAFIRDRGNFYALMLFIISIVATVGIIAQAYSFNRSAEYLSRKLRLRALKTILNQDVAFFDEDKNNSGSLTSQIADHPQQINPMAGATLGVIISNCFTLISGVVIGLVFLPKLAAVGIACIPIALSAGLTRLWFVVLSEQKQKEAHQDSAQLACEGAAAIRTVASLTREDDALRLYSSKLNDAHNYTFKTAVFSNGLYSIAQGITFWMIGLTFWYGSRLLVNDNIEVRSFFICTIAVTFAAIQVGQIFNFVPSISGSLNAARTLVALFDIKPELSPQDSRGKQSSVVGHIRFENVHFRYPTRPHVPVLRGLDIEVKPGQFVALCGQSGCGKSTTIQLLERFYDPLIGRVTVDGDDLASLNLKHFRSQVAVVAQESQLYDGTIRDNILLGSPKPPDQVTEEEIWQACRDANIANFIQTLPDGLDTDLGGKGTQLSGGQRSRICLARALIRQPKILLLDEATSALDSESERVVQDALDQAAKGRSTLAVAHRLSTIQNADKIYVLKDGRVAESGTHQSLMQRRQLYYELVSQQSLTA